MGRSIGAPDRVPDGTVHDPQSGSSLHMTWRGSRMIHRLSEEGMTAEYKIRYQIGAGKTGHSYAIVAAGSLFQSPASFYSRYGWDISPGYSGAEVLDFDRLLSDRCLFCHTNSTEAYQDGRIREDLQPIGCNRCHGDSSNHVKHPSAANIVNPARLPVRARDSVCEQCHLEGVARVLNPGKTLPDFRPGSNLQDTIAIYVVKQTGPVRAVSQEEQLAQSRCAMESQGRLWCGSCHNPHGQTANRNAEIKVVCESCHAARLPASHANKPECVSCHMPRGSPSDVVHAALTDHRIALARADSNVSVSSSEVVAPWRAPAPELEKRDLALAYLHASANSGFQELAAQAGTLLNSLPESQKNTDAPVVAALGDLSLSQGRTADAVARFRKASQLEPTSGEYAMYLGIALKMSGSTAEAAQELKDAIRLNPAVVRPYLELSALEAKEKHYDEARQVLDDYLKLNPQNILVRLTQQMLEAGNK